MKNRERHFPSGVGGAHRLLARRYHMYWVLLLSALGGTAVIRLLLPAGWQKAAGILWAMFITCQSRAFAAGIAAVEKENGLISALYISGVKSGRFYLSLFLTGFAASIMCGAFVLWFSDPAVLAFGFGGIQWNTFLAGDLNRFLMGLLSLLLTHLCMSGLAMIPVSLSSTFSGCTMGVYFLTALYLGPAVWDVFFPLAGAWCFHPGVCSFWTAFRTQQLEAGTVPAHYAALCLTGFIFLSQMIGFLYAKRMFSGKGAAGR